MSKDIRDYVADKLDPKITATAIIVTIVEFELFTIAKGVVRIAQQDAWLSVLIGGIFLLLTSFLFVRLAARFPRENLFQYSRKVWGGPIAFLLTAGFLLFWAVFLTLLFKDTAAVNKLLFLPETPAALPLLLLAVAAAWLATHGLPAVMRFFQLSLPFLLLPLLLIIVLSIRIIDLTHFLPVLNNGIMPVLKGAVYFVGAGQGMEIILFLSPFLTNISKSVKPALAGVTVIVALAFFQTITTIGILGIEGIKMSVLPAIDAMTLIEIPGFTVQRYELLLTLPWLVGMFTTICIFVYLVSYGFSQTFHVRYKNVVIYLFSSAFVLAGFLVPNYIWSFKIREFFNYATVLFVFVIPLLTLLVAILWGKRDTGYE